MLLNLEQKSDEWVLASTWCNLGLWPESAAEAASTPFREACVALATALGNAAALGPDDEVLDMGVGYADQAALWVKSFGVRRVVGIEPSAHHIQAARQAQERGFLVGPDTVELFVGSAANVSDVLAATQTGDPSGLFDVILCLDCAYHFHSRADFLRDGAAPLLRPTGRFAAVDLIVSCDEDADLGTSACVRAWRRCWRAAARRVICMACGIPWTNLYGVEGYRSALEAAGLDLQGIQPIGERVLRPFAEHARRQRASLHASGAIRGSEWLFLSVIAALFSFVASHRLFDVVLVTAVKKA